MALDLNSPFDLTISQSVLAIEGNDARFEHFCRDVVSLLEGGAVIFSTSKSWDLGRDGAGGGTARGIYVCVSLRDDVDAKALDDLQRITSTTRSIKRIYFCSSHKLSEQRISLLESQLSDETGHKIEITCLGATQLTEAAAGRSGLFETHYGSEVRSVLRAISVDPSDETEVAGLRLALIAGAGNNSVEIRRELYTAGLIETLSDGTGRTLTACANALSQHLHLGHAIAAPALTLHLEHLVDEGLVNLSGVVYTITAEGIERSKQLRIDAAERFLQGRVAIRQALEQSIGAKLSEDDFVRIWSVLETRVASYFHTRGAQIVAEISALLEDAPAEGPTQAQSQSQSQSQLSFVDELATAIGNTSTHPQRRAELYTAVKDLFTDRASGATGWLVRVCSSYIACCALGLEYTCAAALNRLFARTALVLDSDVVLSLLGEGEPEHQSVLTIATKWVGVGGKVLVSDPVLEEVAYHASIATNDFQQVRLLLPGTPDDRLRLIENVFVRSFAELMSQGNAVPSQWPRFIGQFAGRSPYDWSRLLSHLKAEYSIDKVPIQSGEFATLERQVREFLIEKARQQGTAGRIVSDKAGRDARLYAAIVSYQRRIRATDPGATCLLVSSARRLMRAEAEFRESGEHQLVVQISTVLQLLSLLPQVSLGLTAMKVFLFEDRRPGFSTDLERTILRLVRSSRAATLPWARRGVLMKELRDLLISDARQQGQAVSADANNYALERLALKDPNRDRTIELLGQAFDKVAIPTRVEEENAKLRRENEELKRRLAEQESKRR